MKEREGIDWSAAGLGVRPDTEIAAELGCSSAAVFQARRRAGIARYYPEPDGAVGTNIGIVWDEQPLGDAPDGEIARDLGVNESTVRRARTRRGIPRAVEPGWPGR